MINLWKLVLFNLFLFLFLSVIETHAQQLYAQKLGIAKGLESNNVYCVFQDKEGFFWFGTDMGVSRFNGYEFQNFNYEDGLTANEVFNIYQDRQGRLWFLSFNGEFCYYKDGEFYNSNNEPSLKELHSKDFHTFMFESRDSTLYVGTYGGGVFLLKGEKIKEIPVITNSYAAWQDQNTVSLFTSSGIAHLNEDKIDTIGGLALSKHYPRVLKHKDILLMGYGNTIYEIQENEMVPKVQLEKDQIITWIGLTKEDNYYVGTRKGLLELSATDWSALSPVYLPSSMVSHTLIDQEGSLWVTTLGEGIYLSPSPKLKVLSKADGLPVDQVTSLMKGKGHSLLIGMKNGYYAQMKQGQTKIARFEDHGNQQVTTLRWLSPDRLAIPNKSNVLIIEDEQDSYLNMFANDIYCTGDEIFLAGKMLTRFDIETFNGLLSRHPKKQEGLYTETHKAVVKGVVLELTTNKIAPGPGKDLYFGTIKGLYKMIDDQIQQVRDDHLLRNTQINDVFYDNKTDLLFVASNHYGLILLKTDEVVAVIGEENGLSSNNCQSLYMDEDGNLWIGTTESIDLLRLNTPQDYDLVNLGHQLGMNATIITDIEKIDSTLYMATEQGLITYDLNEQTSILTAPDIRLISIEVNAQPTPVDPEKILTLNYQDNSISFHFLGLSSKNLGNLSYHYQLEGSEDSWSITKDRQVTYAALKPGQYGLKLRTVTPNNQVGSALHIPFIIRPPFWNTLWFKFSALLFLILLGSGIWWYRINQLKQQYDMERQLVTAEVEKLELEKSYLIAEQKSGLMQMNPHFLFNSLNAIKGYYAQNQFQEANRFISKFARLLRRILECNTALIPLRREIEIINLYLELMRKRYDDIFQFSILLPQDDPQLEDLQIPPMVIQPLVENAVIHGIAPKGQGKLEIKFCTETGSLICTIQDDGVGFDQGIKSTHQSVGLDNIKERLDLMARQYEEPCEIQIISNQTKAGEQGTCVRLRLPLRYKTVEVLT
ncbi:MAG: two-component regulator propeller domain-containing protein [Cytophagales bacterium]|nr:two-component regulator propeller domain-containing protein [Cytophagales bacterium]